MALTENDIRVGVPIDREALTECLDLLTRLLKLDDLKQGAALRAAVEVRIKSRKVSLREARQAGERELLTGTFRGAGDKERIWVGSPLNLHRRCEKPMFEIVNEIAYHDQMINCTPARPEFPSR